MTTVEARAQDARSVNHHIAAITDLRHRIETRGIRSVGTANALIELTTAVEFLLRRTYKHPEEVKA